jgi:hypothetical protein
MAVDGVAIAALALGCTPPVQRKPIEMAPIGTVANLPPQGNDGGSTTTSSNDLPTTSRDSACTGGEFEALDDALKGCGSPMPKASELVKGLRDKVEVTVTSSTPSTSTGGRVDITVTLRNKSAEPVPLFFTGDPNPHFEMEATDAKGKRSDLPAGKPPKSPPPNTREVKASRITLTPNGTARLRVAWDAVKTRWAPEKMRTWDGRGYPRAPVGNLPLGRYTLRVFLPIIGELDIPKLPIDVGS